MNKMKLDSVLWEELGYVELEDEMESLESTFGEGVNLEYFSLSVEES